MFSLFSDLATLTSLGLPMLKKNGTRKYIRSKLLFSKCSVKNKNKNKIYRMRKDQYGYREMAIVMVAFRKLSSWLKEN